jgi:hypothetical protein
VDRRAEIPHDGTVGIVERVSGKLRRGTDRLLSRFEDPLESFEYARRQQLALLADIDHRLLLVQPGSKEERNLQEARANLEGRIAEFQGIIQRMKAQSAGGGASDAADKLEEEMRRLQEDVRRYGG